MRGDLRYRAGLADDRAGLVDLFSAVYGERWAQHTSAWRYLPPSKVRSLVWVAESEGRIVGAQPSQEIALHFEGSILRGSLLLDVMTHPDFRRQGVFSGVVEGLRKALFAEGVRVLITTPNPAASRAFATLPAWHDAGELVPLLRPVRWRSLLRPAPAGETTLSSAGGRLPAPSAAPPASDARIRALWRRFSSWSGTCVVRDPEHLVWRYGAHTGRSYRLVARGSEVEWTAVAITSPGRLLNRRVLFLVDLIAADAGGAEVGELLDGAVEEAASRKAGAVVTFLAPGSPLIPPFRRAGFLQVPRLLRPRPYAVWMATDLPAEAAGRLERLETWHMSLADSDLA